MGKSSITLQSRKVVIKEIVSRILGFSISHLRLQAFGRSMKLASSWRVCPEGRFVLRSALLRSELGLERFSQSCGELASRHSVFHQVKPFRRGHMIDQTALTKRRSIPTCSTKRCVVL